MGEPNKETMGHEPRNTTKKISKKTVGLIAAVITVLAVSLCIMLIPNNTEISAYYTLDINPSVCLHTDENDIVVKIECVNQDATDLMANVDCIGLPIKDALELIINAANDAGYVTEQQYILIGKFTDGDNEESLKDLQAQLEANFGDMVNLIIVSGSFEDKQSADDLAVSAGLLKLSNLAGNAELNCEDGVEDIIGDEDETPDPADRVEPTVSGEVGDNYIRLNWTQEPAADLSGYKIVASTSNPNPSYPDDGYIKYITNASTSTVKLYEGDGGLKAGTSYYFSVTYLYDDDSTVAANAVKLTVPKKEEEEKDDDKDNDDSDNSGTYSSSTISGSISGNYANLSWSKINKSDFDGYKVMYSFSDSTPVYGESGCNYAKYITDASTTSCKLNVTELKGYQPNVNCWFSITVLYDDHNVKKAGNAIKLIMPNTEVEPYVSTTISGHREDNAVYLSWDKIEHANLDGYKVMYSFSDSTPVYGESGCNYYKWITNASTTSCTITNVTELKGYSAGATCYFSITALYNSHDVKKPGNTISIVMPDTEPEETQPYVSTTISGHRDGYSVSLNWDKIEHENLDGYKVMYSFSDSTPVYGESGCTYYKWITNASTTSCTITNVEELSGYSAGATCYFSITALYNDHEVKKAGNTISIVMPAAQVTPSLNRDSQSGNIVNLSWDAISHDEFVGFKLTYSCDGGSGTIFSNSTATSETVDLSTLSGYTTGTEITYTFKITAIYSNGATKNSNTVTAKTVIE